MPLDDDTRAIINSALVFDEYDRAWLRDRVQRHLDETDSAVASRLLANWDEEQRHFYKVMPQDLKRVLAARQAAEEAGTDPVEAVMAAARS